MVHGLLVTLYVIVCLFLIGVVLLQTGKRADLAGAFGGGGSQTAFGTRGAANLLTKLTTVAAVAFMVLALTLAIMSRRGTGTSVLDDVQPATTPAAETGAPAEAPAESPDGAGTTPTEGDPANPDAVPAEDPPADGQ